MLHIGFPFSFIFKDAPAVLRWSLCCLFFVVTAIYTKCKLCCAKLLRAVEWIAPVGWAFWWNLSRSQTVQTNSGFANASNRSRQPLNPQRIISAFCVFQKSTVWVRPLQWNVRQSSVFLQKIHFFYVTVKAGMMLLNIHICTFVFYLEQIPRILISNIPSSTQQMP